LWKTERFFFWSGIVVPDNLFIGKIQKYWNGQIVMGDLPKLKIQRVFQSGLIVMGNLSM
jgi:hypothetical protein